MDTKIPKKKTAHKHAYSGQVAELLLRKPIYDKWYKPKRYRRVGLTHYPTVFMLTSSGKNFTPYCVVNYR